MVSVTFKQKRQRKEAVDVTVPLPPDEIQLTDHHEEALLFVAMAAHDQEAQKPPLAGSSGTCVTSDKHEDGVGGEEDTVAMGGDAQLNSVEKDCRQSFMDEYAEDIPLHYAHSATFKHNTRCGRLGEDAVDVTIHRDNRAIIHLTITKKPSSSWQWQHMTAALKNRGVNVPLADEIRKREPNRGSVRRREAAAEHGGGSSKQRRLTYGREMGAGDVAGASGDGGLPKRRRSQRASARAAAAALKSIAASPREHEGDESDATMDDAPDENVPRGCSSAAAGPGAAAAAAAAAAAVAASSGSAVESCKRDFMLMRADPKTIFSRLPEGVKTSFALCGTDLVTVTIGPFQDACGGDYYVQGTATPRRRGKQGWSFSQDLRKIELFRPHPESYHFIEGPGGIRIIVGRREHGHGGGEGEPAAKQGHGDIRAAGVRGGGDLHPFARPMAPLRGPHPPLRPPFCGRPVTNRAWPSTAAGQPAADAALVQSGRNAAAFALSTPLVLAPHCRDASPTYWQAVASVTTWLRRLPHQHLFHPWIPALQPTPPMMRPAPSTHSPIAPATTGSGPDSTATAPANRSARGLPDEGGAFDRRPASRGSAAPE
ncbi:unnamed protein product [Vitrella brassicaformis CCMP3155]|uniref:Uncharacterized protein n=1 Tax=Vitrella brassicaformis (strain CCMP3155) TaxID=1169540 RepID=A0A0G4H5R1_VITBC|nr:unnamed protein product [Vitrella brassicaformis CCMP3155]|eukprot:CEM39155.1 unnamed protein product [Vitrella brassicaformis CCMP3155]